MHRFSLGAMLSIKVAILLSSRGTFAYRTRNSFQTFFPDVDKELSTVVAENCSHDLLQYQQEKIFLYGTYCVKMYSCVMEHVSEYTKENMASASVLLGLTPTVLAILGPSTVELSLLSSRRFLLAFLLALSSPSVNPLRSFTYYESITDLIHRAGFVELPMGQSGPRPWAKRRFLVEFALALMTLANIGQLCYSINWNTVAVMSCDNSDMLVELWVGLTIVTHLAGIATLATITRQYHLEDPVLLFRIQQSVWNWVKFRFKMEFNPKEQGAVLELVETHEINRFAFIPLAWFTSVFTVIHMGFGTMVLASLSFIGSPSAALIVGRFLMSALVSRMILIYEISVMRAAGQFGTSQTLAGNPSDNPRTDAMGLQAMRPPPARRQ